MLAIRLGFASQADRLEADLLPAELRVAMNACLGSGAPSLP
jgi:hypothetical protein